MKGEGCKTEIGNSCSICQKCGHKYKNIHIYNCFYFQMSQNLHYKILLKKYFTENENVYDKNF